MFQPAASLTFGNARTVLDAGLQAIADGQDRIDFAGTKAADSSAVAVLLAWRRAAAARGAALTFANLPDGLRSLIALYDVAALLDVDAAGLPPPASRTDLPHH